MKICKTENEYIEAIALAVQKACKRYGYLPSVLIAQSCLENGYGIRSYWDNPQIEALLKGNNMVGIKCELLSDSWRTYTVWNCKDKVIKDTPEEYGGKMTTLHDAEFRAYESIEQSFCDFLLFLKYGSNYGPGGVPKYGDEVLAIKNPEQLIKTVAGRGYATGRTYPTSVMRILNEHGLTKYDDLSKVEPSMIVPDSLKLRYGMTDKTADAKTGSKKVPEAMININRQYLTTNNTNSTNDPKHIVIHNTDNYARTADAYAHAEGLYHGYMEGMSWHYVTDDHSIYQCVPHNRGAWHVGKNFGSNNLFGVVNNRNSIGIEMCVNAGFDYEKAFQNTVALTKYLMKELNIPASKVYQHYDICTKNCPSEIRKRGDWARFKKLIGDTSITVATTITSPGASTKSYLSKGDSGKDVETLQTMLNACGYDCGTVDGDFGSKTDKAVRKLQSATGLVVDGMYGAKTKGILEQMYKNTQALHKETESTISGTTYNGVDYSPVYNYSYYKKKYADLQKAFGNDKDAYFRHFCQYGMKEGRKAASSFDVQKYKAKYADLRKAFGENLSEYYKHYCIYGKKEGRKAT